MSERVVVSCRMDHAKVAAESDPRGYLAHARSVHDRRSIRVWATERGHALSQKLRKMHQRHLEQLQETDITETDLKEIAVTLRRLERFWMRTADLTSRSPEFAA